MNPPPFLAGFDSTTAMFRALSSFLHGRDFPKLGDPKLTGPVTRAVSSLPPSVSRGIYRWGGWLEALSEDEVHGVDEHRISEWVAGSLPARAYPAVAVGSSNGAAIHLCAALGVPWLPQTVLTPVRRRIDVDDLEADMRWGRGPAAAVAARNPTLHVHQMSDPNQDRMMLPSMGYLRLKRLRLGEPERAFLRRHLEPGGTIVVVDCRSRWPLTRTGDRTFFQAGGPGGLEPEEYLNGSGRVAEFLEQQGSPHRRFLTPEADTEGAEGEWGFDPDLLDDLAGLAAENGWRLLRLAFDGPDDLSGLVADVHRAWYRRLGRPSGRLLVNMDFLLDPYWTLAAGCVPFWTSFPVEPAAQSLERHLDQADPYDEIHVTLFSHGVRSAGMADAGRWEHLMRRARRRGDWAGVRPRHFPWDFNAFVRYHTALRALPGKLPLPPPLTVHDLERFMEERSSGYPVRLEEGVETQP